MIRNAETEDRVLRVEVDRRQFLKRGGAALGFQALGLASILAACGDDSDTATDPTTGTDAANDAGGSTGGGTLRVPFVADMQVPDPDIMYEGEGNYVMHSVYEGLINYDYTITDKGFVPELAESYEVSADGITYTFHLRDGVTFHDGTPMDAQSWVASFERRLAVDLGPAYMVKNLTASAPDPLTFVVTLDAPNNAFLDYLACPWRPYAVSPTAVAENEVGGDLAQEWLTTHDAGTGPYTIVEFQPGTGYKLEYFEGYWGPEPAFTTVEITIVPDSSTQRLLLEQGEIDFARTLSFRDNLSFEDNPDFQVFFNESTAFTTLWLNPTTGVLGENPELRAAIMAAIDRENVLGPTYDGLIKVTPHFMSPAVVTPGVAPLEVTFDTSLLAALAPELSGATLDLAYRDTSGPTYRQMGELIQTQLAALGLDVTVRGVPSSEAFSWSTGPEDLRPDLYLATWGGGGDMLHIDGGLRIFVRTGAAPLNYFNYSNPEVDELMDVAVQQTDQEEIDAIHAQLSEILQAESMFLPFGPDLVGVVMRAGISNVLFNPYTRYLFDWAVLENS